MADRISGLKLKGRVIAVKDGVGKDKKSHLISLLCSDGNGGFDTAKVFSQKLEATDKVNSDVEYTVSISVGNRGDLFIMRAA